MAEQKHVETSSGAFRHSTTLLRRSLGLPIFFTTPPPLPHNIQANFRLPEKRPSSPADSESPSELLRRALSVRSVVSTSSSFAERMNQARTELLAPNLSVKLHRLLWHLDLSKMYQFAFPLHPGLIQAALLLAASFSSEKRISRLAT